MSSALARTGTISYAIGSQTVTVGVESTTDFFITPVYDSSGRTTTYNNIDATFNVFVTHASSTDTQALAIRRLLLHPGGKFTHTGTIGFGDLLVNDRSGTFDVVWGPKPQSVRLRHVGDNKCIGLEWRIRMGVKECPDGRSPYQGILESNYSVSHDVDASGYSRRVYTGHLIIAQTRRTALSRNLRETADQYRELIVARPVPGFRREAQRFELSEDKCRIDFVIVDHEMPLNIPPEGIVRIEASHTVESIPDQLDAANGGVSKWGGHLTATIEVAKNYPKTRAMAVFADLMNDRLGPGRKAGIEFGGAAAAVDPKKASFLVTSIRMGEPEIYGRNTARFDATYLFTAPVNVLLQASGLWRAVPNSDWQKWSASLAQTSFHHRGYAGLQFTPDQDVIIDLCDTLTTKVTRQQQSTRTNETTAQRRGELDALRRFIPGGDGIWRNRIPEPEFSWLTYNAWLRIEVEDGAIVLQPLPKKKVAAPAAPDGDQDDFFITQGPGSSNASLSRGGGGNFAQVVPRGNDGFAQVERPMFPNVETHRRRFTPDEAPVVQYRVAPKITAIFWGVAERAGWPIVPPAVETIGGVKVKPINHEGDGADQGVRGNMFGVPIFRTTWRFRYLLPELPRGIEIPKTPWAKTFKL